MYELFLCLSYLHIVPYLIPQSLWPLEYKTLIKGLYIPSSIKLKLPIKRRKGYEVLYRIN